MFKFNHKEMWVIIEDIPTRIKFLNFLLKEGYAWHGEPGAWTGERITDIWGQSHPNIHITRNVRYLQGFPRGLYENISIREANLFKILKSRGVTL